MLKLRTLMLNAQFSRLPKNKRLLEKNPEFFLSKFEKLDQLVLFPLYDNFMTNLNRQFMQLLHLRNK